MDLINEIIRLVIENKYWNVGRVLEIDLKYVKLVKIGGWKNLLCYKENECENSGFKRYEVVVWYYYDSDMDKEKEFSEEERYNRYNVMYGKWCYKIF